MVENSGPTLTNVTYIGRQVVKYGSVALVVMIVGRMSWGMFITYWRATHRPPPPPPTVGFGLLPRLRFPEKAALDKPDTVRLEIASGILPAFGDRAGVYFMPKQSLGLFTDQRAKEIAANHDFVFEPEILSTRLYRWSKSTPLETTFQLDIQSLQLKLTTNYLSRPDLVGSGTVPDNFTAIETVKSFMSKIDLLPSDMATSSGRATYQVLAGTELVEALSYSDAEFVQVDLNRTPIAGLYEMYTPNGFQGVVSAIVTGSFSGANNIVQLISNYHPVDSSEIHTYPLRPTSEAWQVLQSGEGYIATKGDNDTAVVREVVMGYYDDFEEQDYLQPIYVFIGDDGFLGYVSALDQRFVQVSSFLETP
jgi:hypothetical protein